MIVKSVSFAYPTSDMAKRLGHNVTGCWYVSVGHPDIVSQEYNLVDFASEDRQAVLNIANSLDYAWDRYSMHM